MLTSVPSSRVPSSDGVPRQAPREILEVVGEDPIDQLHDPPAAAVTDDEVGPLLEHRQRVGYGRRELAEAQECMVVLGVADADDVVRGEAQLVERDGEPGRLVDPRGEHHDGPFIEDDLPLQAHLADRLEDGALMGLDGRDDRTPDGYRRDAPLADGLDQRRRRRLAQHLLLAAGGPVEQRAILDDHAIEEVDLREDLQQLLESRDPSPGSIAGPSRGIARGPTKSLHPHSRPWPGSRHNPWPAPNIASGDSRPDVDRVDLVTPCSLSKGRAGPILTLLAAPGRCSDRR